MMSRTYKEFSKFNSTIIDNPSRKWAKDVNEHYNEGYI